MRTYGNRYCNEAEIQQLSTWEGSVWYYDGTRVYQNIGDYTGETSWYTCARYVRDLYRSYVINNPRTPGWRVFPHGLAEDYLRNGDTTSREAVRLLANESAFAWAGGDADPEISRETAYLIHAYLAAEDLGFTRHRNLETAVNFALGHLDQWTGRKTAPFVKPFMVGLTFEALINYYEHTGDARVLPAVKQSADWLWDNMWNPSLEAFPYIYCRPGSNNPDCGQAPSSESADLNLLIATAYSWLYRMTGEQVYLQRGDAIFSGGVRHAWLGNGKQFSQNYRWSFDFFRYREGH